MSRLGFDRDLSYARDLGPSPFSRSPSSSSSASYQPPIPQTSYTASAIDPLSPPKSLKLVRKNPLIE